MELCYRFNIRSEWSISLKKCKHWALGFGILFDFSSRSFSRIAMEMLRWPNKKEKNRFISAQRFKTFEASFKHSFHQLYQISQPCQTGICNDSIACHICCLAGCTHASSRVPYWRSLEMFMDSDGHCHLFTRNSSFCYPQLASCASWCDRCGYKRPRIH